VCEFLFNAEGFKSKIIQLTTKLNRVAIESPDTIQILECIYAFVLLIQIIRLVNIRW
jgi:hypothetical protein